MYQNHKHYYRKIAKSFIQKNFSPKIKKGRLLYGKDWPKRNKIHE